MELPHLGEHCFLKTCNRLDFLPFTCEGCKEVFCKDHQKYEDHNCQKSPSMNQVPICPLCNEPVAKKPQQDPNYAVNLHIENNCSKPHPELVFKKCNFPKCKGKDSIPIQCNDCNKSFCIPHRHPENHSCQSIQKIKKTDQRLKSKPKSESGRSTSTRLSQASSSSSSCPRIPELALLPPRLRRAFEENGDITKTTWRTRERIISEFQHNELARGEDPAVVKRTLEQVYEILETMNLPGLVATPSKKCTIS